jgi:hypothetical protein
MHSEHLLLGWFCHLILSAFLLQVGTSEKDQHFWLARCGFLLGLHRKFS